MAAVIRHHFKPAQNYRAKEWLEKQSVGSGKKWWQNPITKKITGAADASGVEDVFRNQKTADDISEIIAQGEAAGKSSDEILQDIKDCINSGSDVSDDKKHDIMKSIADKISEALKEKKAGSWKEAVLKKSIKEAIKSELKEHASTGKKKWHDVRPTGAATAQDNSAASKQWSKTEPLSEEAARSGGSGSESEYICVDSRVIDRCIEQKDSFISRYDKIVTDYNKIVDRLSQNWKGRGADTFIKDARVVRTNIKGIADILANMVNVLTDIRTVIGDVDHQLGENNRNPEAEG